MDLTRVIQSHVKLGLQGQNSLIVYTLRKLHCSAHQHIQCSLVSLKGKGSTAHIWQQRQKKDPYVKSAQHHNYRCRSAFKLIEIDDKHNILKPGDIVVDCGAAPGSWTQVAVERVNANAEGVSEPVGKVIAVDRQYFPSIPGATILSQKDFTLPSTQEDILHIINGQRVQAVISDMAPNASGVRQLDHDVITDLAIAALKFSVGILDKDGHFLCKIWQGANRQRLETALRKLFQSVKTVKPLASRTDSAEVFVLAKNFNGKKIV